VRDCEICGFPLAAARAKFLVYAIARSARRHESVFAPSSSAWIQRLMVSRFARQHATLLLDSGVPVHAVAQRLGHDPAVLLRNYAKRTRKVDASAANAIGNLLRGILA
jgi:integrase